MGYSYVRVRRGKNVLKGRDLIVSHVQQAQAVARRKEAMRVFFLMKLTWSTSPHVRNLLCALHQRLWQRRELIVIQAQLFEVEAVLRLRGKQG
jgi:cob(I)alamin adenosyltransferase